MQLAMKLVVAQFCRAKDHELSMKAQIVCGEKMRCSFRTTTSYEPSLVPRLSPRGGCNLEINIPPQQIYANSKGGFIRRGRNVE